MKNPQENNKIQSYLIGSTEAVLQEHRVITRGTKITQMHLEWNVGVSNYQAKNRRQTCSWVFAYCCTKTSLISLTTSVYYCLTEHFDQQSAENLGYSMKT